MAINNKPGVLGGCGGVETGFVVVVIEKKEWWPDDVVTPD